MKKMKKKFSFNQVVVFIVIAWCLLFLLRSLGGYS